ncbi:MAG: hypothetical protein M1133_16355 [Armatimonadetes bacterium]|nr:hypothetical protein [Armatimonadota bacterium]
MIYGERTRRELNHDEKGLTGKIVYICDWTDIDPAPIASLPKRGDAWPDNAYLRCVHISANEIDYNVGEYTAYYSTERQLAEEFCEVSLDYGLETGDYTEGWTWETAGTPVTDQIPTSSPVGIYTIRVREPGPPEEKILEAMNKVNSKVFRGYAVENMRFDGASTSESYDINGDIIAVATTYKFTIRDRSHNQAWRKKLQALDIDGNPIVWQHIDAGEPYYTTDSAKIGTPVWVNQVTGQEAYVSGTCGWDKPTNGGAYRYGTCDFAAVLGLPKKIGDG